jgi:hypothetical protein
MTGINATEIIQNLEFMNSFAVPISPASAAQLRVADHRDTERKNVERISEIFRRSSKMGPVHTPTPRSGKGRVGSETSFAASNGDPISENGTLSGRSDPKSGRWDPKPRDRIRTVAPALGRLRGIFREGIWGRQPLRTLCACAIGFPPVAIEAEDGFSEGIGFDCEFCGLADG